MKIEHVWISLNDLFKSSRNEQKRKIINLVFSNLQMDDVSLCYSLKKPFDKLLDIGSCNEWRE